MKKYLHRLFVAFIFLFFIFYSFYVAKIYSEKINSDLSSNVFRLHILANSDSNKDQALKLAVRDSILKYLNSITKGINKKEDVVNIVDSHLLDFKRIAKETIKNNGYNYNVDVEIGNFSFPSKNYKNISLPAGNYDSLRIKIGDSKGHNWWCVMFPQLCFSDLPSGIMDNNNLKILKNGLTTDEYNIITQNSDNAIIKFKIVELINNLYNKKNY